MPLTVLIAFFLYFGIAASFYFDWLRKVFGVCRSFREKTVCSTLWTSWKNGAKVFRFYLFLMRNHMTCPHICKNFHSIYLKINHTYIHTVPPGSVTKISSPRDYICWYTPLLQKDRINWLYLLIHSPGREFSYTLPLEKDKHGRGTSTMLKLGCPKVGRCPLQAVSQLFGSRGLHRQAWQNYSESKETRINIIAWSSLQWQDFPAGNWHLLHSQF